MKWLRFAAYTVTIMLLQASALEMISVTSMNIKPDLIFISVVFFSIYCSSKEAIVTSFALGLAADIVVGSTMGPYFISFGVIGTLLANTQRIISLRKIPYQAAAIFIGLFSAYTLAFILRIVQASRDSSNLLSVMFTTALYSIVIGPFLFPVIAWICGINIRRASRKLF